MTSNVSSSNSYNQGICVPNNSEFEDDASRINHFTEVRVAKRSPVKPAGVTTQR